MLVSTISAGNRCKIKSEKCGGRNSEALTAIDDVIKDKEIGTS